jgi:hypothetical protein
MELSAIGKSAIRPFAAFGRRCLGRCRGDGGRFRTPILGSRMNAPDIAGFVERHADHPALASCPQGDTVRDSGGRAFAGREFVQEDFRSGLQWSRKPYTATLGIYHQGVAGLGKRIGCVQASNAKRNLGADSGATPPRFCRFFCRVHRSSSHESVLIITFDSKAKTGVRLRRPVSGRTPK